MLQVGFDVGGSNIAVGAVNDSAEIVARRNAKFPTGEPYQHTVGLMASLVEELAVETGVGSEGFASIGVAVPGSISRDCARVEHAYNLQFHHVPLRETLQGFFPQIPVVLGNDANAAALAELHAGAFQGCRTAVLITLGTGVGGGLILGGRMFNGGRNSGVELGHMVLLDGGTMCTCGVRGCIEAVCTATWLVQQGRISVVEYPKSMIATEASGNMDYVTAKLVIDCAKAADKIAMDIFERYVGHLGSAVASIMNMLDPEVVALGGGVSQAGEFLFGPLRENVMKKAFFKEIGEIVPARLGNDAGIVGAAMLHKNNTTS